jgi:probable F420-dependent oxidoreductase
MSLLISAKVPTTGTLPEALGIGEMAASLERAGFDGLWVSDHVVMPERIDSPYPFAPDRKATWATDVAWYDAIVAMAMIAGATSRAHISVAVLVLPLRHPVELAKQVASIDVLSGGRTGLGVGAGWLKEEFDALNVPFETRGGRLDEWMALLRSCWSGRPAAFDGQHYRLPAGVLCLPAPAEPPPILVGGTSRAALRRAGRLGDGWVAHASVDAIDLDELRAGVAEVRGAAAEAGRDPEAMRMVLRLVGTAERLGETAAALKALAAAGVHEVVVDTPWTDAGDSRRAHDLLREAAA